VTVLRESANSPHFNTDDVSTIMPEPRIVSIQVGEPRDFVREDQPGKSWTSAIIKTQVNGPVLATPDGLPGDHQVDRVHHGGRDKAILAYAVQHYPHWKEQFPSTEFTPGGFGENLTIENLNEELCCIGDVWTVGDCQLEVSQPRQPCWKLSKRWGLADLSRIVQQTGRTGWYLRVLQPGTLGPGLPMMLNERPFPEMTVAWANTVMYSRPGSLENVERLASCPALSDAWRVTLRKRSSS